MSPVRLYRQRRELADMLKSTPNERRRTSAIKRTSASAAAPRWSDPETAQAVSGTQRGAPTSSASGARPWSLSCWRLWLGRSVLRLCGGCERKTRCVCVWASVHMLTKTHNPLWCSECVVCLHLCSCNILPLRSKCIFKQFYSSFSHIHQVKLLAS